MQNALIAGAAELHREVTFAHDKWTVNQSVELLNEFPFNAIARDTLVDEASE